MSNITLLDGGMGQELVHRSGDMPTSLWATQVMLDHPGLVREIHDDYFAAGASLATTNTYAAHDDRLVGTPQEGRQARIVAQALDEATAARGVPTRRSSSPGQSVRCLPAIAPTSTPTPTPPCRCMACWPDCWHPVSMC